MLGLASNGGFVRRGNSLPSGAGETRRFQFKSLILIKHLWGCRESAWVWNFGAAYELIYPVV